MSLFNRSNSIRNLTATAALGLALSTSASETSAFKEFNFSSSGSVITPPHGYGSSEFKEIYSELAPPRINRSEFVNDSPRETVKSEPIATQKKNSQRKPNASFLVIGGLIIAGLVGVWHEASTKAKKAKGVNSSDSGNRPKFRNPNMPNDGTHSC